MSGVAAVAAMSKGVSVSSGLSLIWLRARRLNVSQTTVIAWSILAYSSRRHHP